MAIDPTRSLEVGARAAEAAREALDREASARTDEAAARTDQVEISDEARALAEQGGVDGIPSGAARLAEIAERLESGFYDRPEIVEALAERLLESDDL